MSNNIIKSILEIDNESWKYPSRFKSFLMDLNPEDRITRHIIMVSVEEGIPNELVNKSIINQIDSNKLIKRIISSSGCEVSYAKNVLWLWMDAFGISNEEIHDDILYYPVTKLNLRWDLIDKLQLANIDTIRELCMYSKEELLSIKGIGKWFVENVVNALNEFGLYLKSDSDKDFLYGYPSAVTEYDKDNNDSWAYKLFMDLFKYLYECNSKYKSIVDNKDIKKKNYILYQNYEISQEIEYILDNIQKSVDSLSRDLDQKFKESITNSEETGNPLFIIKYTEDYFLNLKKLIKLKIYIRECSVSMRFEEAFNTLTEFIDEIVDCLDDAYEGVVDALKRIELMEYASREESNYRQKSRVMTSFDFHVSVNLTTEKLKQFGRDIELAYSLPVDEISNKKNDTDMMAVVLAFRKKNEANKEKEKEEFYSTLSEKVNSNEKKVVDSFGIRWFRCRYCDLIAESHYFSKIGYNNNLNKGICKYCSGHYKNENGFRKMDEPISTITGEICPDCGAPLRISYGRYGEFIGCTAFPKCRYTRNIKQK